MISLINYPKQILTTASEVEKWLDEIATSHNYGIKDLIYTFVDNKRILDINKRFLNHDYFTDIITFDYCKGRKVLGEIFISVDQIKIQAKEYAVEFEEEFLRVVAHGLLHLIGFDDKKEEDRQMMRKEEEKCLVLHSQIIGN